MNYKPLLYNKYTAPFTLVLTNKLLNLLAIIAIITIVTSLLP